MLSSKVDEHTLPIVMAMISGDPLPPAYQQAQHGAGAAYGAGNVGADQAYKDGAVGAGTTMPVNAALGAGAGGAYPPAGYEAAAGTEGNDGNAGYGGDGTVTSGGRNEFQAGDSAYPAQGGTGLAPDRTAAGPGTGVASSGIRRLP